MLATSIKTFSIGFGAANGDKLPVAREDAALYGTKHVKSTIDEQRFQDSVARVLAVFDQPFFCTLLVPTAEVARLAAERVKLVLTGDWRHEVFGGYNYGWYRSPFLESRIACKGLSRQGNASGN